MKQVSTEERDSLADITTVEQREKRVEVVIEDTDIKQELIDKRVVTLPQAVKDDWFVLLDVPITESSPVPPGTGNYLLHL